MFWIGNITRFILQSGANKFNVNLIISQATQSAFRRSMEEETIARMQEQMNEMMDWRKTQMQHDVDERIAAYLQEYGFMPGQGGDATSERGEDDDDDEAAED